MAFYAFKGKIPRIHPESFVHPMACVIGDVIIGKDVYIGPYASLRADFGRIIIKNGSNVQDSCTIHMFPGVTVLLEEMAHIGHGAIVHGAKIGRNVLVGMHAVIMDGVEVGENSIIGALSFVNSGMKIPPKSLVVGSPAKIVKEVNEELIKWKTEGTLIYQQLSRDCREGLEACNPVFSEFPEDPDVEDNSNGNYKTWDKIKNK